MDVEQINNILTNSDKEVVQFSNAQILYLQDNNNNQYANQIQFISTTLKTQFVDYHNGWFWIPFRLEIAQPAGTPPGFQPHPPIVALRESILSLIANITVSTDQGQNIVNDVNTQFINNLRLRLENNFNWTYCEGSDLDFAYDRFPLLPSNTTSATVLPPGVPNAGSPAGPITGYQTGPSFLAPQGIELGTIYNAPLTNDYNKTGTALYGSLAIVVTGTVVTGIGGLTISTIVSASATYVAVTFTDGRVGYLAIGVSVGGILTSIGDVTLAAVTGTVTGTVITRQVVGYTQNLDNPNISEQFTVPLTITLGTGGIAATAFTTIGGIAVGTVGSGTYSGVAYGANGMPNPFQNQGFDERVTIFQNTSAYQYLPAGTVTPGGQANVNGYHVYYHTAKIPLKYTHDFWMQLNFPVINMGFNIQLYLAQSNGPLGTFNYPPFMVSNNTGLITGGADATPAPAIFYGQGLNGNGCRLYYRAVKFSPDDNAKMAAKLTEGFTKSIKYVVTDWIIPPNNLVGPGTQIVQHQLEQSVVHPVRVWQLGYPNNLNVIGTNSIPFGNGSFIRSVVYAPGVVPGSFTQTNILLNNVPYYLQNLQTIEEQWNILRDQFTADSGAMIRFIDWLNYYRIGCFDLTRIADRLSNPTQPVSIQFQGQRNDGLPYSLEMFYLVEREMQITFRFSSSDVAIVVGNLD